MRVCLEILREAHHQSLKAVELANTLRARVGTEPLSVVREVWGGLLSLLEHYPHLFLVERIPKNDVVSLIGSDPRDPSKATALQFSRSASKESDNPSRCLHISNVQPGTTEDDIQAAFGAFGDIEDITMVSQRSRRFAFVRYRLTEDAVRALQSLCSVPPWSGAISYAHHEEPNSNLGFSSAPHYRGGSWGGHETRPHFELRHGLPHHLHPHQIVHNLGPVGAHTDFNPRSRGSSIGGSSIGSPRSASGGWLKSEAREVGPGPIDARFSRAVIAVLTDDTYVPTQSWPSNFQQDAPFLNAIISQLQILGGVATISKLRGLLKSRVLAQSNIKSVPLKALLTAYPKYFTLNGNLVELTPEFMHSHSHLSTV